MLFSFAFAASSSDDIKQKAIALYATGNYQEAFEMFNNLPSGDKDENVFLLMANISQENGKDNAAIQYLNKALNKDYTFYKAYYNLGCIFAKKKSYLLACNNFEFTIKYNKTFAPAYYNLACCQMNLKNYDAAKKNLIKALELEPQNKDYMYNLIVCYKELNQLKQAKKLLDSYNSLS
ncbi:tetratricopeptide repeat protein [bacterium]|nr:tetratricopeptide repeat protein [bacterium]